MWQDYVFGFGQIIMSTSLVPMVFHKEKPPLWTSAPTAIVCFAFALTFATLGLWFSVASSGVASALWFILVFQRLFRKPTIRLDRI